MEIPARLAADLNALTLALGEPTVDIEALLRQLGHDAKQAVASYAGLSVRMIIGGRAHTFTSLEEFAPEVRASVRIPLAALWKAEAGSAIVFYASDPGAFVDLAADLQYVLELDAEALVLDGHLVPRPRTSAITGLDGTSTVNMAIGVLIEDGHLPEAAHTELVRLAALDDLTLSAVSEKLISRYVGRVEGL
jgi:hypothetical protein